jgi:ubiquinone/menaquinone biosynthesis C-methylase UbiE
MQSAGAERAIRTAYFAQHESLRLSLLGAHWLLRTLSGNRRPNDAALTERMRARYRALLERDLSDAARGVYPHALLFEFPLRDYTRRIPLLMSDLPRVLSRKRKNSYRELPADIDLEQFPAYYRRNFHFQSDGYLSAHSAKLYDIGVELLFLGAADVMRRRVLAPLVEHARTLNRPLRVLDIGCGTGRTLRQLVRALPNARAFGVDLSPPYIEHARQALAKEPQVTLISVNAEELPFRDGYFDAVASVYLFHELPRAVRRKVAAEAHRVLADGGVCIIEDSAQCVESPEIAQALQGFSRDVHEPFYADYLNDDLSSLLTDSGFEVENCEPWFVSKVVTAKKPRRPA